MKEKTWEQIQDKLNEIVFKEKFDLVVTIGRGGVIPGFLVSKKLKKDLELLWLKRGVDFKFLGKKILLADDVTRTGKTLMAATKHLEGAGSIKTFVINGKADYSLYNEECFKFPWS